MQYNTYNFNNALVKTMNLWAIQYTQGISIKITHTHTHEYVCVCVCVLSIIGDGDTSKTYSNCTHTRMYISVCAVCVCVSKQRLDHAEKHIWQDGKKLYILLELMITLIKRAVFILSQNFINYLSIKCNPLIDTYKWCSLRKNKKTTI